MCYRTFVNISLIFHLEISHFHVNSSIFVVFDYFCFMSSLLYIPFHVGWSGRLQQHVLGLSKAVSCFMFNKSRVCLHAWYYPHMSIHTQNRHFCMYLSIDIYDQIIHTQHILNMFQCVLRVNSCLFHVYNVVFISKMSDIITSYRKTRIFRLFVYWS